MKNILPLIFLAFFCIIATGECFSQTKWKGTVNTNWSNASNWTGGVPTSAIDVIIGDGSFTGPYQPTVNASASCKSITVGGVKASTLTLTKNLVVSGDFAINSNGTITHPKSTLTVKGNWINNGSYTTSNSSSKIIFGGNSQLISGSSATTYRDMVINAGSLVTLGSNLSVSGTGSSIEVKGTFDPGQSPTYILTSTVSFTVFYLGKIKVNASTFSGNYALSGSVTLSNGSYVEYSSTTVDQTVSPAYSYTNLIISGTGTKALTANLPSLNSSSATQGNIFVNSGILDLGTFTANRGTSKAGGSFNLSNGAYLKVGASNFPSNYLTYTLSLGSTVEYNGINQTISGQTYGNLIFSSKSGASIKTLPGADFTIEGNFSSTKGSGTSVSYTAASNITMNGNIDIGASTTFNAGGFSHMLGGNWVNNGVFNGNTGSITFDGPSSSISGAGTQNFNNLNFVASGITAASGTLLNVSGNMATSSPGQFSHASGGLITMTGAAKLISGDNIVLNDLTVSGSVTTSASFSINGNLSVPGSFSAGSGTIIMSGASKTISGAGAIGFSTLNLTGSIVAGSNFSISSLLEVEGSFSASAGTATFTGSSVLAGTANLYNVTLNGTSLQLSATSILGIANIMTITAGSLNVTSTIPNTVNFNGTGAQNINPVTYNNLVLSNGNIKTAAGNVSVNANITIASSTTFAGGSYMHSVLGNWINNGTYTASTGTVQFTGANNASITGATTFNILTVNKSAATTTVTLLNNVSTKTVNMATGKMLTGTNRITITSTRAGNGIIIGTITRTHAFSTGTAYAFEGPYNTITLSSASGVTSITETVILGTVSDFPNNSSINREYNIAVTGTSYNATLRLHYEDAGLNGNNESSMGLWNNPSAWAYVGKTAADPTNNYVELSGLTNISYRWTCSEIPGVVRWNGSISSNWNTAANWTNISGTASTPPAATDIVQIGTAAFTNQPTISTVVNIKAITFGSAQAATLTIAAGGSLTTNGNIGGSWSGDAVHTINTGNQNLTVNGDLTLSYGVTNRSINLSIGSGTATVLGTLTQKGNASINFSGNGSLLLGSDFVYSSGNFVPGTGTVIYNGIDQQDAASVAYNNLTVNNASGNVTVQKGVPIAVAGNLSLLAGQLQIDTTSLAVSGNVTISSGATLNCSGVAITAAGNWSNSGTYLSTTGTVTLNGTGTQNISAGNFNNLIINKSSGVAVLTGNNTLAGNLSILSGTLNLATYSLNRQNQGGSFSMASGTLLQLSGANNFPSKYAIYTLDAGSTTLYNGSAAQSIAGVIYGNLTLSNGGINQKTQTGDLTIAGDLLINSGATFNSGGYTTTLKGNWTNSGSFNASTGTLILNGTGKTLIGNTTFNKVTINGSYTVAGSDMTYNGLLWITTGASYVSNGHATVSGDLTNNGTLIGNGTTTFTGTSVQTIRLVNALLSSSTGIINFNGNVSPVLNSNSSPQFATLNVNNTAGLNSSVSATVYIALNVGMGAILNTGNCIYTIYGSFNNAGTVSSIGTLNFTPLTAKTLALGNTGFSSDGTVIFGGSGQITLTGKPDHLNTVIVSNTSSGGFSPSSDWSLDSNLVINKDAIFNAGPYTYTVGGDIISDGTLNGDASTFITTSDGAELSVSAETVFNHLISNGSLTPQTDFDVAGNFTNNGTYDGSIGILTMTGSNAATIGGTTTPSAIAQLNIQKSSNATVTQSVNLSELSFLDIMSGTLFTSTYTITQDAGGGVLIIEDSATLKLGGSNSLPGFSGYGLAVNSNVDYAGASTQTVGNAADYGNLIISGTGNKNAYTALTVLGNLSMSSGTLNTSTVTVSHSIAGNFIMTGGSITGTNANYILNGTEDQTLILLSNLVKLTVSKTSGTVNPGSNVTINNILTFTSGNIRTGNYKVILPSTGSVIGATQNTGWVYGNLQKNVATGTSVSRSFEIGDSTYYTPATVLFASVSTAGNFIAKVTAGDHTQADYSGIDTTKSVNRYWSLTNAGVAFTSATATFNWVASDIDAGANYANFKTAAFDGSNWLLNAVSNPLSTSIKAIGCTSFGDFQIGEALSQYRWTGGAMTSDWNTKGNWLGGVPTTAFNTLIPSGISGGRIYPSITSGTVVVKDLTVENSAALTVTGASLQIYGALSSSGTLDASEGTIEMKGSTAQSISGSMFNKKTVKNLIVSNTGSGLSVSSAANDTLKITGTLSFGNPNNFINTGDNITLVSNNLGTASVGIVGAGNAINGKVIVERYINTGTGAGQHAKSWQLLSTPANGQTLKESWMENGSMISTGYGTQITGQGGVSAGFDAATATPSIKTYDAATASWTGITNGNAPVYNAKGYMVFVRGDKGVTVYNQPANSTTLRIKGTLLTGSLSPISVIPGKWESVGNPYASPVDFNLITKDAGIDDKFYVWDPYLYGTYGLGGYQTLSSINNWEPVPGGTSTYKTGVPSKTIQSGQAFFVHATPVVGFLPATYTLTFTENCKASNSSSFNFARMQEQGATTSQKQFFRTSLFTGPDGIIADGNTVAFDRSFSDNIDGNDALKIANSGENFGLKRDGQLLSIEAKSPLDGSDTIYYNMSNLKARTYQLRFAPVNLERSNLEAYLLDQFLKTSTLISLTDSTYINIEVTSNAASSAANRFKVVFKTMSVLPVNITSVKAYAKEKNIAVEWKVENESNMLEYEVEKSVDGNKYIHSATIPALNHSTGKYICTDQQAEAGNNYYRIRSISRDDKSAYTKVVKVLIGKNAGAITVFPNPIVNRTINLQLANQPAGIYGVRVLNVLGQLILSKDIIHAEGGSTERIECDQRLAKGIYQLEVTSPGGKVTTIRVVN